MLTVHLAHWQENIVTGYSREVYSSQGRSGAQNRKEIVYRDREGVSFFGGMHLWLTGRNKISPPPFLPSPKKAFSPLSHLSHFVRKPWLLLWHLTNKFLFTKETGTNFRDLPQPAARTEAACCNNSDACWLFYYTAYFGPDWLKWVMDGGKKKYPVKCSVKYRPSQTPNKPGFNLQQYFKVYFHLRMSYYQKKKKKEKKRNCKPVKWHYCISIV